MPQKPLLSPVKKFQLAMLLLATLILIGTLGLIMIENMDPLDALYMTIITLSTVGFGEVHPLHPAGRIFIVGLIIFGVAGVTYGATAVGQMILEGELRRILGRRKMDKKIKRLDDHHIIAGFGRVGRQVADEYARRRVPFVVIENDNAAINYLESTGYSYVSGEATEDIVLDEAGMDRAKVLVSTLPSEADNVYLTLTARHMNPNLLIIARADHSHGEKKLKRAGANVVVSPHVLGGMRMAMASLRPNVVDFMQMTSLGEAGLGIEELMVPEKCDYAGKSLVDSRIKAEFGVTVIGVKKPNQSLSINPDPGLIIRPGDILILIGSTQSLETLAGRMS